MVFTKALHIDKRLYYVLFMLFFGIVWSNPVYPQSNGSACGYAAGLGCSNTDYNNFGYNSNGDAETIEYDNYVSTFHSTLVRTFEGNFMIWGENTARGGGNNDNNLFPVAINSTNYSGLTGIPIKATIGSNSVQNVQTIVLTSDNKLWIWGSQGAVITSSGSATSGSSMQVLNVGSNGLPSSVSATDVKSLFATYQTLALLTCDGEVWVLSQNGNMRGNGSSGNATTWSRVQVSSSTNLSNIIALRASSEGFIALDGNGDLWTWGKRTYLGDGSGSNTNRTRATQMTTPSGVPSGAKIKMIGSSGKTGTGSSNRITYYMLYDNGYLYALGDGDNGTLGDWNTNNHNSTSWVQPRYTSATGGNAQPMRDVVWFSPSDHDGYMSSINIINENQELWNWGEESGASLGRGATPGPLASPAGRNPGQPASAVNEKVIAVETGGHTTMISALCHENFGYVGHLVRGSMGDGRSGSNDFVEIDFSFETAYIQACGVNTVPVIDLQGHPLMDGDDFCKDQSIILQGIPTGGEFTIISGGEFAEIVGGNRLVYNPESGSGSHTVTVQYELDEFGSCEVTTVIKEFVFIDDCTIYKVTGNVWVDSNEDAVYDSNENGTNANGVLWANLVNEDGEVVASVPVNSDGTYELLTTEDGTYSVVITNQQIGEGTQIPSATHDLPGEWEYTGHNDGTPCVVPSCTDPHKIGGIVLGPGNELVEDMDFGLIDMSLSCDIIVNSHASCVDCPDGSLTVDVIGGTAPYTYAWSNGGSSQTIGNLMPGDYTVTVTDANNGTTICSARILSDTGYCIDDCNPNAFLNAFYPNTIEYDNIIALYHSTIIKEANNIFKTWGASTAADGTDNLVPVAITPDNGYSYTGAPLRVTGAAMNTNRAQYTLLTTDGLYFWGKETFLINNSVKSATGDSFTKGVALETYGRTGSSSFSLPIGDDGNEIEPHEVKMLFGTFHVLGIVTCNGEAYILSDDANVYGDGGTADIKWHRVMVSSSQTLDNVVAMRGSATGTMMALTSTGEVFTWGKDAYIGGGATKSTEVYATQMDLTAISGTVKMIGKTGANTYYILTMDGKVYGLGDNAYHQIGDWTGTERRDWVRVQKSSTPGDYLDEVVWISPNEHSGSSSSSVGYETIAVLTQGKKMWSWGHNSRNMLGDTPSSRVDPTFMTGQSPAGLQAGDNLMAVVMGGHTLMVIRECTKRFGYIGHRVRGSMADGSSEDRSEDAFNFTQTAEINLCGAATAPAVIDLYVCPEEEADLNDAYVGVPLSPSVEIQWFHDEDLTEPVINPSEVGPGKYYATYNPSPCALYSQVEVIENEVIDPTIQVHEPTCDDDGYAEISNYQSSYTYTFSPSGPSVSSSGVIENADFNIEYTVSAVTDKGCETASDQFLIEEKTIVPSPIVSITDPTCLAIGYATIYNYDSDYTYVFNPAVSGATISSTGKVSGLPVGSYTVKAINADDCESEFSAAFTIGAKYDCGIAIVKSHDKHKNLEGCFDLDKGETITYSFEVHNLGNVSLSSIQVTDLLPGLSTITHLSGDLNSNGKLDSDEIWIYGASYNVSQTDIDNGHITNQATVYAVGPDNSYLSDLSGNLVTNDVPTVINICQGPAISLYKVADKKVELNVGDLVTYTFTATNIGNVTLTDVTITDPLPGLSALTYGVWPGATGVLTPGQSIIATATYTITQDDVDAGFVINTATTTGKDPDGKDVEDEDDETVTTVQEPGISLDKVADVKSGLQLGDIVTYTFTVTNTGDVTLTDVVINDALTGSVDLAVTPSTLAPGQTGTASATYTITQADVDNGSVLNTATATGKDPEGEDVEDEDDETVTTVQEPAISLDKVADVKSGLQLGDVVTYTFTVTNTGDVTLTDVVINDALTGSVDLAVTPSTLAPGQTGTASATYTITQADVDNGSVLNTATATGKDPDGEDVEDEDDETVTTDQNPGIQIVKVAEEGDYQLGDIITYTFTVSNTGNVSLTNIEVTDPLPGLSAISYVSGDLNANDTLEIDEVWIFEATYEVTQVDVDAGLVYNNATVTGDDPNEDPVEDEDDEEVEIGQEPGIQIVKVAAEGDYQLGDIITYTFTVSNTGNVSLTNIEVTDPLPGLSAISYVSGDLNANDTLEIDEVWIFEATYEVTQADVDAGLVYNNATVTGDDPNEDPVEDEDDEEVEIGQEPGIQIVKVAAEGDYQLGDIITYTFTVSNTGNVSLTNIEVTDPLPGLSAISYVSGDLNANDTLEIDEVWIFEATYEVKQADVDAGLVYNNATVTGDDPNEDPVEDEDDEEVEIDQNPGIEIVKVAAEGDYQLGDIITYTFTVSNTGNVSLTNIEVTDPLPGLSAISYVSGDLNANDTLEIDEVWIFEATYEVTQADVDAGLVYNNATVTGDDPNEDPVEDEDDEEVEIDQNPGIEIVKVAAEGDYQLGDIITYTFTVSNTGNVSLTNIEVTDPLPGLSAISYVSGDLNANDTLEIDEVWIFEATYEVTQADVDAGLVYNNATVTGDDPNEDPVEDEDDEEVEIDQNPGIEIVKVAAEGDYQLGDIITYTFTVSNTGNVSLTNIEVTDPLPGLSAISYVSGDLNANDTLEIDEVWIFEATYEVTQADVDAGLVYNNATVTGDDPNEDPVEDEDDEEVEIDQNPGIEIVKVAAEGDYQLGDIITYTFTVSNTGNVSLTNIEVTDPLPGLSAISYVSGDVNANDTLEIDEVWIFEATYEVTQADVDAGGVWNNATVTGDDPNEDPVEDEDDEEVEIEQYPGIEIVKVATEGDYQLGDIITYTFTVSNTGNVSLTNIEVTDPLPGLSAISYVSGDLNANDTLEIDEVWIFEATYEVTQADVDAGGVWNNATVTGDDPNEDPVEDEDDEEVEIEQYPGIEIVKVAAEGDYQLGDIITYTFTVSNTGNVSLTNIEVTDPLPGLSAISYVSGDLNANDTLEIDEVWIFEATYEVTQADVDAGGVWNNATVTGDDPNEDPVEDEDDEEVEIEQYPGIEIVKVAAEGDYQLGDIITYTFTVSNTGNVSLTNIEVTDPLPGLSAISYVSGDVNANDTLEIDEVWIFEATYEVTQADVDAGGVWNNATVTGDDPNEDPVEDEDDEEVEIEQYPGIAVVKLHNLSDMGDDCYNVEAGDEIIYTFIISNEGNVTLNDVNLIDPLPGLSGISYVDGDLNGNGLLDVGEEWTYEASYIVDVDDLDNGFIANQAIGSAVAPNGDEVMDYSGTTVENDDETVIVICLVCNVVVESHVSCFGGNDGSATVSRTGGISPYSYLWSDGQTTETAIDLTAGIYTVTVSDADGRTSVCAIEITEPDAPTVSCPGDMVISSCESQAEINAAFANWIAQFENSCDCELVSITDLSLYSAPDRCGGETVVTYTVEDECGNIASCTATFTVEDAPEVIVSCPAPVDITSCTSQNEINAAFANWIAGFTYEGGCEATASDLSAYTAPDMCEGGTVTIVYVVTDACGQSVSCTSTFSVEVSPVLEIDCPGDIVSQCDISQVPAYTSWAQFVAAGGSALNTCGVDESTFTLVSEVSDGAKCPEVITRVYSVTDVCGNTAFCTQTITINDTQAPVLTIVNPEIQGVPNGGVLEVQCYSYDPYWEVPSFSLDDLQASDNCEIVSFDLFVEVDDSFDCKEDGYYLQVHYLWIAVDACGNTSQYGFYMRIIDNIPPVFLGVPEDITLSCGEILYDVDVRICDSEPGMGVIHVIDECECATVEVELDTIPGGCASNYTIVRRWIATDNCGNTSVAEQYITYVDESGPVFKMLHPELANIENEGIYKIECTDGGMPDWILNLGASSVFVVDNCTDMTGAEINFSNEEIDRNIHCSPDKPYFIRHEIKWSAVDDCGNVGEFVIYVDLIDNTPPVIEGAPEYVCGPRSNIWEGITVYDECTGDVRKSSREYQGIDPCTGERVWIRELIAVDNCGNTAVVTQYLLPEVIEGPTIKLLDQRYNFGDTIRVRCDLPLPEFTIDDVQINSGDCEEMIDKSFEYVWVDDNVCTESGYSGIMKAVWKAEDRCGNVTTAELVIGLVDKMPPLFTRYDRIVMMSCGDVLPDLIAVDACSYDLTYTVTWDTLRYDCYNDAEYIRTVVATDECGNFSSVKQRVIYVPTEGVEFMNVPEDACGTFDANGVYALDMCTGDTLTVSYVDVELENCGETVIVERTWYAVGECGVMDSIKRHQILNSTGPEFVGVHPDLVGLENGTVLFLDCIDFALHGEFKASDVAAYDECGNELPVQFKIERFNLHCERDGAKERINYYWIAEDVCGTVETFKVTVNLVDNMAPELIGVPEDITIICDVLPPVPKVHAYDDCGDAIIGFEEWQVGSGDEYDVYRRWTATDACGNRTQKTQRIHMYAESDFECEIYGPENATCNSKEVYLYAIVHNGHGPYKYEWEIVSGLCLILDGQGTTRIHIFTGFSESVIRLKVTDRHGCVTECYFTIECEFIALDDDSQSLDLEIRSSEALEMAVAPNPANDLIQLSTNQGMNNVRVDFVNMLGQVASTYETDELHHGGWHAVDVSNLQPGTYIMLVHSDSELVYRERIEIVK